METKLKPFVSATMAIARSFFNHEPIAKGKWPTWAEELKSRRLPGESGIGDTAARIVGPAGGDAFKKVMKRCGCGARQETLNKEFPYADTAPN